MDGEGDVDLLKDLQAPDREQDEPEGLTNDPGQIQP